MQKVELLSPVSGLHAFFFFLTNACKSLEWEIRNLLKRKDWKYLQKRLSPDFATFVESNFLLILQINGIIQKSCFQTFPNIYNYKKWGTKHFWDKKSPKKLSAVPQPHTEPSKTERDVNYCGYHCIGAFYWLQINTFYFFH